MTDTTLSTAGLGRRFTAGHFALRLGSGPAADVTLLAKDFDGGAVYADVIPEFDAGMHFSRKHLGPTKYEEFTLPLRLSMSDLLFDWIAGSWGADPESKDGAVLTLDHNFGIRTETAFGGALITGTTIPLLDASSKDPGYLTVRFQPEVIQRKAGAGKLSLLLGSKPKLWQAANFRLQIGGLDCTKVARIESFTVRREVVLHSSGAGGTTSIAGRVTFPNLLITLTQVSAQTWYEWHEDFVVNGNNGEGDERSGTLSFLTPDLKQELSRIDLHHLGIVRIEPAGGPMARVTAELYCEEMRLKRSGGSP